MSTFKMSRQVAASRERVWPVVSDVAGLAEHAPNLSASEVVEGDGEGMVRRCHNQAGEGWNETCTRWDHGRRFTMEVDTSDYPYPLTKMVGTWEVEDDPGGSRIVVSYDYDLKYGALGRILGLLLRPAFSNACTAMLDSYEEALGHRGRGVRALRRALRLNAAFSATSGLVAIAARATLSPEFGVEAPVFAGVGAALVLFGTGLLLLAARPAPPPQAVRLVVALDALWVAGTVLALATFSSTISTAGTTILVGVAALVAVLAHRQSKAVHAVAVDGARLGAS